jgi:hypothetical protein
MLQTKVFLLAIMLSGAAAAGTLSYTGTLPTDDSIQLFFFTLPASSTVTIESLSFAGGANAAGTTISSGGFSPDIWLFDSTGTLLQLDSPESPEHSAPGECGPRAIDPSTGFCWDAYQQTSLSPGSYTVALTQDGNVLNDGFSLAGGFSEQGDPNYTDVLGLGGMFYLPDGITERDSAWAVDISGIPVTPTPEPGTWFAGLILLGTLVRRRFNR